MLERRGHTEATVDMMRMAGLDPAGVLCELTNDDGTMSRLPELVAFAQRLVTVTDVVFTGAGAALVAATGVLAEGRPRRVEIDLAGGQGVCGGRMEIFLEPVSQAAPFWVIGAGHVGRALVEVGRTLPFRFILVDDRPEILADLPAGLAAEVLEAKPADLADRLKVPPRGALLLASRSMDLDADYLEMALAAEKDAGREFLFLGGIASRRKAGLLIKEMRGRDADPARLDRMQLPVGLAVGAEPPAEIAARASTAVRAAAPSRTSMRPWPPRASPKTKRKKPSPSASATRRCWAWPTRSSTRSRRARSSTSSWWAAATGPSPAATTTPSSWSRCPRTAWC